MSMLAMPFLITNMGAEMIYILEQRLHAQNIPPEKSAKVLQDVLKSMFSAKFITELMKPQPIYSSSSTRDIFDRLAHSSIMRLSPASMDKLYDLMTMGFKYQLVSCVQPRELVNVTMTHIEELRKAIEAHPTTVDLIDSASAQIVSTCVEISNAELTQIRQTLATFLQDKRIKVSLFLQDGIQNSDGTIVLPKGGIVSGDVLETPGLIRYYDEEGTNIVETDLFLYPLAEFLSEKITGDREARLGKNMYTLDRSKKAQEKQAVPSADGTPAAGAGAAAGAPKPTVTSTRKLKEVKGAALAELNSLRDSIVPHSSVGNEGFHVNYLFGDQDKDIPGGPANREIVISKITREEMLATNRELAEVLQSLEIGDYDKVKDLLGLMDDATS